MDQQFEKEQINKDISLDGVIKVTVFSKNEVALL